MKHMFKHILPVAVVAGSLILPSCKTDPQSPGLEYMPDMYRGTAYEAYGESPFSEAGSSLKPVSGTIPRYNDETLPYYEPYKYANTNEGYELAGAELKIPYAEDAALLEKGKKIYTNFCVHCHGEKGDGNGTLVQRDKFAGVPSYYGATLQNLPEGKMYHTIYYGKNMMGSHASQINYAERWAVIGYVKKLRADGLGVAAPAADTTQANTATTATAAAEAAKK
jgi:mono/diheme cytochrome c family protein